MKTKPMVVSWRQLFETVSEDISALLDENVLQGEEARRDRKHKRQKEVFERGNKTVGDWSERRSLRRLHSHYTCRAYLCPVTETTRMNEGERMKRS